MMERFTADLVFILVALILAALLGFLIGYLPKRVRRAKLLALEHENAQKKSENARLESKITLLNNEIAQLKVQLEDCLKQKESASMSFNAAAAREVFKTKIVENDLKIVEGIGEKIESLLNKRGITTWHQLAQTPANTIKDILLQDGGSAYQIHEPRTWPDQAMLAHQGKWKELKELQDNLTAGR
jgi:predicted flap endonuclease-1-like 5' DNA nuclease